VVLVVAGGCDVVGAVVDEVVAMVAAVELVAGAVASVLDEQPATASVATTRPTRMRRTAQS
jgi:hypothetical protein